MLIEFTTNAGEFGRFSTSWLVCPEMIVAISDGRCYGTIHDESGRAIGECRMTRIDVIGGGKHYVLESVEEVRKKWEKALAKQAGQGVGVKGDG